jgi:hypothetical protein
MLVLENGRREIEVPLLNTIMFENAVEGRVHMGRRGAEAIESLSN